MIPPIPANQPHRWRLALAVPVLTLGLLFAACDDDETALEEAVEEDEAAMLVGQQLTVSGDVTEVLSENLFVISGEDFGFDDDEGTVVIVPEGALLTDDGAARVRGEVVQFIADDIEQNYDVTLAPENLDEFDQQYAIVAEEVTFVPDDAVNTLEVLEFTDVGREVSVAGEVSEVLSAQAFRVGEGTAADTLVVTEQALDLDLEEGDLAQVSGVVREVEMLADPEVRREYGIETEEVFGEEPTGDDERMIVASEVAVFPEDQQAQWTHRRADRAS